MRIVIVGGNAAGMSAASRARRQNKKADICVFQAGEYISYASCGMPYALSGEVSHIDKLIIRTPQQMRERGIAVHTHTRAEAIDTVAGVVHVRGADGKLRHEPYDRLLIATGTQPIQPPFYRRELEGVHLFHTVPQLERLQQTLLGGPRKVRQVALVGGGYIGLELAEVLRKLELEVTLFEASKQPAGMLAPQMRGVVAQELRDNGVELCTGVSVEALLGDDIVTGVATSAGEFAADAVVVAVGVAPNTALAQAAGVRLGDTGAIAVSRRQKTNLPNIYAAGDCCEAIHCVSGQPVHIPLALTANRMGRVAGVNMAGGKARFPGIVGTGIFKVFGLGAGVTGLTQQQAEQLGLKAASVDLETTDIASYMGEAQPVRIRLTGEKGTGRLLGAQILAHNYHAAKRIDVIAALLGVNATAEDLFESDLAYAPPFSSTWDFPLVAADKLLRIL